MQLKTIGVVGLGMLGRGICAALAGRGFTVFAVDLQEDGVVAARDEVFRAVAEMRAHQVAGVVDESALAREFVGTTSLDELSVCDFVIESVAEDINTKHEVMSDLEAIVSPETPIATNTSAIPIECLQRECKRPERVLGMHWAEPAYATRFLELIRGDATSEQTFQAAIDLAALCEKEVCVVERDLPGFIANRLGYAIIREAANLVELGVADAETVDRSFRNSVGLWAGFCGPLRWVDITGGPELYAKAMKPVLLTLSNRDEVPDLLRGAAQEAADSADSFHGIHRMDQQDLEFWQARFRHHAWSIWQSQTSSREEER